MTKTERKKPGPKPTGNARPKRHIRATDHEWSEMLRMAEKYGYDNRSEYIRAQCLEDAADD